MSGRVRVHRLNIEGDAQADLEGHGGEQRALMVYQVESYRYWEKVLERSDFIYGQFGENLTVEGLEDTQVCIGDRYRIGGAVFEVTQPRVTCYKLGLRMNEPRMAALVVAHRRPGFYFRVIEEGDIGAGDLIEKISAGPEQMSVAEVDALLYLSDHPLSALQRALKIPALSPGWRASMQSLLEAVDTGSSGGNAGLTSPAPVLSWPGFREIEVIAVHQESEDVRSFELAARDRVALPRALPGQHLVLRLNPTPGASITRIYSLCGALESPTYRIAVKKEAGVGSTFLHSHVNRGDRLNVSAPRGDFTLVESTRPAILLSAGIGVTPLLSMLHSMADSRSPFSSVLWWIHSARDAAHHSFAAEAHRLIEAVPHGHSCILYSHPQETDRIGADYDVRGRIDLALLTQLRVPRDADFYLCGPAGYLQDLRTLLGSWGVPASRVHYEVFGAFEQLTPGLVGTAAVPPHPPEGPQGTGPTVAFVRSGLTVKWNEKFKSLLELSEACAVPVRWSCRTGVCHTCESGMIDGRVQYDPQPLDAPASGRVLICCATPLAEVELDL